jgi:hypothetical protein
VKWQAELVCVVALVAGGAWGQEVAANLPDMPEPKVETVRPTVSVPVRPHGDNYAPSRLRLETLPSSRAVGLTYLSVDRCHQLKAIHHIGV